MLDKVSEVSIARNQADVVIEARLGDQDVRKLGFEGVRVKAAPQQSSALPVPVKQVEQGERQKCVAARSIQIRRAKQFGEDDWRKDGGAMFDSRVG